MSKFLSGRELEESICEIIYEAKKHLLIISPFIKLDDYFKKVFNTLAANAKVRIVIGFGKNENQINRSFNNEDFEYFKKFPNISIVYIPNLHAKYYANEKRGIITSINLYDYSFKNNIEFGLISEPSVIGNDKFETQAWDKTMEILTDNNVVFVRTPNFHKKLIGKDYVGSETRYDVTNLLIEKGKIPNKCVFDFNDIRILDNNKPAERISRQDFEKQNENKQIIIPQEVIPQSVIKDNLDGFCIHCHKPIEIKPMSPYCKECKTTIDGNGHGSSEKFCHICGEVNASTKQRPACYKCYQNTKSKYEYYL
jgi:hypothetical protein